MTPPSNPYPPPLSIGTPLVSIILPVYNAEPYLAECLRSVLAQSYQAWELLLVNNGSTDGSLEVAAQFKDPRITILHETVKGVSRARNKGLARMQGEFFCLLDADDILPEHSLRLRLDLFRRYADATFADGAMRAFNTHNGKVEWVRSPWYHGPPFDALMRMDGSVFAGNTWMVKRCPGIQYHLPEHMDHSEDHAFFLSLSRQGVYVSTPRVVLEYRTGHRSANSNPLSGHLGYVQLFGWMQQLQPPPSPRQLDVAWKHLRRVMFRDLLKSGRLWPALKIWRKPAPLVEQPGPKG